jgi:hypothetical protein
MGNDMNSNSEIVQNDLPNDLIFKILHMYYASTPLHEPTKLFNPKILSSAVRKYLEGNPSEYCKFVRTRSPTNLDAFTAACLHGPCVIAIEMLRPRVLDQPKGLILTVEQFVETLEEIEHEFNKTPSRIMQSCLHKELANHIDMILSIDVDQKELKNLFDFLIWGIDPVWYGNWFGKDRERIQDDGDGDEVGEGEAELASFPHLLRLLLALKTGDMWESAYLPLIKACFEKYNIRKGDVVTLVMKSDWNKVINHEIRNVYGPLPLNNPGLCEYLKTTIEEMDDRTFATNVGDPIKDNSLAYMAATGSVKLVTRVWDILKPLQHNKNPENLQCALEVAVTYNHIDVVEYLLINGANSKGAAIGDKHTEEPLLRALGFDIYQRHKTSRKAPNLQMVRLLLNKRDSTTNSVNPDLIAYFKNWKREGLRNNVKFDASRIKIIKGVQLLAGRALN